VWNSANIAGTEFSEVPLKYERTGGPPWAKLLQTADTKFIADLSTIRLVEAKRRPSTPDVSVWYRCDAECSPEACLSPGPELTPVGQSWLRDQIYDHTSSVANRSREGQLSC
jgi:hypothetical protein